MRKLLTLTISLLSIPTMVVGIDLMTGRSSGIGGTILLSNPSASALVVMASTEIKDQTGSVEIIANRQFEIEELDRMSFVAGYRYRSVAVAIGLDQFGSRDFYAERAAKVNAMLIRGRYALGIAWSGMLIDFGPGRYAQLRASALGLSASARYQKLLASVVLDDLNGPTMYDGGPEMKPRYSLYLEFMSSPAFSTMGRVTGQDTERPQFGLGQYFHVSRKASFFWGYATAPSKFGGGIEVKHSRGSISYATSVHTTLGFTHQISLLFRFGDRQQEEKSVF